MNKSALGAMAIGLALATTACSTNAPSPNKYVDQAKSAAAQADQAGQQAAGGALGGDPNAPICAASGTAGMQSLFIGLQVLAQPSVDYVVGVRSGQQLGPALDIAGINQGIKDYRVLDGHPATGYKDPRVILDKWQDLSDRMAAMVNAPSDPTQADIDSYTAAMGDQQSLIMSQIDVSMAKNFYCGK
jgi:hypothetical protein